jgi:hypothetical protein
LSTLGSTNDPELVQECLDLFFSDRIAIQDVHNVALSLAANPKVRHLLWDYMKTNWGPVSAKLLSNNIVAERFVKSALVKFSDETVANDVSSFFKDKDTGAYARGLVIVQDSIQTNARYKERDEKLVLEWLESHGYA